MMKLYYHPSPNPAKVALFLEETDLEYELVPVDTRKGEQHLPAFTAINPNAKTPALCSVLAALISPMMSVTRLIEPTTWPGRRHRHRAPPRCWRSVRAGLPGRHGAVFIDRLPGLSRQPS